MTHFMFLLLVAFPTQ